MMRQLLGNIGHFFPLFLHAGPANQRNSHEARQAVKVGAMRYVLGVGIAGTALGFLVAWYIFGG